jgi:hypothetical protein
VSRASNLDSLESIQQLMSERALSKFHRLTALLTGNTLTANTLAIGGFESGL